MKKILILTSKTGPKIKDFVKRLEAEFSGHNVEVTLGLITDVWLDIQQENTEIFLGDVPVEHFDLVLFRGIKKDNILLTTSISMVLEKKNVIFLDSVFAHLGASRNKLASAVQLGINNISLPRTLFFAKHIRGDVSETYGHLVSALGIPFVAKNVNLHRGGGLYRINTEDEFNSMLQRGSNHIENFIFQKFLVQEKEYRLLVLGDVVGVVEEKIPPQGEWRANVSLGAKEVFLDPESVPSEIRQLAVTTAKSADCQMAGVDILVEKESGKLFVLESNRGPGLTYLEESKSPEFKAFGDFLKGQLKRNE